MLSTFIKLPFVIKIFVLSNFEWPFYTGFTVCCLLLLKHSLGTEVHTHLNLEILTCVPLWSPIYSIQRVYLDGMITVMCI